MIDNNRIILTMTSTHRQWCNIILPFARKLTRQAEFLSTDTRGYDAYDSLIRGWKSDATNHGKSKLAYETRQVTSKDIHIIYLLIVIMW